MTSDGSNAYINDILDFSESPVTNEKSEIVEFLAHTNVLVTGGTGFLGKLLVEKLLRVCPDLNKLYMTVRPKKGKTALERYEENFDCVVYDKLKREQPNFMDKVVMLEGDAAHDDYGLSLEDKKLLMDINIIFHAAAVVRFDEKIRVAAHINVRSTKFLLTFAKGLPNLKAFVHVSTAFAHCTHTLINEIHYKDSIDGDKFLTLVDAMDDEKLEKITPILLDKWPNTYVYTKAIGENIVLKYTDDLPVCIVRPSIVLSTDKEPLTAWTNNMYGATGVVLASGVGLLRTLHCVSENIAEVIPADYVVSNIVASAWDIANKKAAQKLDENPKIPDEERIPIYNSVSSCQNPISWGVFMNKNAIFGVEIPSIKVLWYYMLILNRYLLLHNICAFFLHTVPAVIVDTIALLSGRKPTLLDAYRKIHKFSKVIHYFSARQWRFKNDNVVKLWEKMNSRDRQIFCFNTITLDWEEYFYQHMRGLRTYMLNDPFDTVEEGIKRYAKLRIAHYTVTLTVSLLLLWILVSFVSYIWSFWPLSH
ncbi:Putative fatty acyl-CoA reductase [Habropoda laboriosa]|uniref:Fatty acyl-CoA reductase n=1 Tax=Habropoda laboriosa TaxID=597456 RepID=A0A0L7R054_9HYME|nr:PREDICTED: putative fatty acyl-CoA reductase CG5065 [Habropoda laboriosa]KOC64230.1 Putative fatty acyl-CoA reductase [Habropoda laboriosa]